MMTIKHVLAQKGRDVRAIPPDATVFDALKLMAEHNVGSLAVLENGTSASSPNGTMRGRSS